MLFRFISQQLIICWNLLFLIVHMNTSPANITGVFFSTLKKRYYLLNNNEKNN